MYASIDGNVDGIALPAKTTMQRLVLWLRWGLSEVPGNLRSSLTLALVNIPLSIALSIACGGTPVAGILTAFWAGSLSAFFGGSEFNITGTTGALAGVLQPAATLHSPAILQWVAIWTSLFGLIAWRFKVVLQWPNGRLHLPFQGNSPVLSTPLFLIVAGGLPPLRAQLCCARVHRGRGHDHRHRAVRQRLWPGVQGARAWGGCGEGLLLYRSLDLL